MTKQFEVGKTYSVRSLGDYDCIYSFEILSRTAKTVRIKCHGQPVTRKIRIIEDIECIDPLGRYSLSPVLRAGSVGDAP